ncbi:reverse transcriptase domain-containing protein [Tanacetum coccineum]|uniref:Reverse transcriptase domain-containing protein n=1 Tax=Tanacetum coccineum TaxID=301880 RepID=A0ABQ5C6W2_9ASTR
MGELTFFLVLQVKQMEDGIFISQDKYVTDILKKFGFIDVKTASTPMETQKLLLKDEDGKEVDVHLYRSMIGSLMYLMSSRPDIMFVVCACDRYQVNPKVSHLHAVKRIFRVRERLFSRETPYFNMMVQAQEEMGEGSASPTDPHHTPIIIQPSTSQPQKKQKPRKTKRKDTEVPHPSGPTDNVADEVVYEEMDDSLERAATTATSLDAEQDMGNINKTQSKATLNEPSSLRTSSGSGLRRQETMGDTIAQTEFENVSKISNDSLLAGVNTPRSDEENKGIDGIILKRRVKILEKKRGSRTHRIKRLYKVGLSRRVESDDKEGLGEEDASKQGRIADIDADVGINLVSTHFDADTDMFGVHDLVGDQVVVETEVASKDVNLSVDEVTLAQALTALKIIAASTRPKAKGFVIHEEVQATTPTVSSQQPSQVKVQDKGKGIMVEEPKKPMKKKELIRLDEEIASKDDLETLWELVKAKHVSTRPEESYERVLWGDLKTIRVPYDQRNNPPQHPRIVYPPILNINFFRHFLDILRNYDPIDDEPMWAANRVVALTPGSAITILETANEFAIKGNHLTLFKGNQFDGRTKTDPHKHIHEFLEICDMLKYRGTKNEVVRLMMFPLSLTGEAKTWLNELNEGTIETWDELRTTFIRRFFPPTLFDRLLREIRAFSQHENESLTDAWLPDDIFLYKTPYQAYQLLEDKVLLKLDWAKNQKTKTSLKKTVAFVDESSSNTDTDKIMARMDAMTIKMDTQYKELQSRAKQATPNLDDDDIPMSHEEEAKFMQTFLKTRFYNDYRDRDSNRDN